MDAIANSITKTLAITFVFFFLFTTSSCLFNSQTHTVHQAGVICKFSAPEGTFKSDFEIKGTFSCKTNLKVGMGQSEKIYAIQSFSGNVDTSISMDFYEGDLFVILQPDSCVQKLERFNITFWQ